MIFTLSSLKETTMLRAPAANEMQPQSHLINNFTVRVDSTTTLKDVLSQRFWASISSRLRTGDVVDIFDLAGSVDIQVRMLSVVEGFVRVRVLRAFSDDTVAAAATEAHVLSGETPIDTAADAFEWRSLGENGFVIINRETKEPALRGIASEREAITKCDALNAAALVPANSIS
jgi:hypothetical protein